MEPADLFDDDMQTVPVVVTAPLDGPFDYLFQGPAPSPGQFVIVPFGSRDVIGVVWDYAGSRRVGANRIKNLHEVLDVPPMPASVRRMIDVAAEQTLNPRGALLKLAIPVPQALQPAPRKPGYRLTARPDPDIRLGKPEIRAIDVLAGGDVVLQSEITRRAKVTAGKLREMAERGLIEACWPEERMAVEFPDIEAPGPQLSAAQAAAAKRLVSAVGEGFSSILLEGVPGAGKTEVYLEAVIAAIGAGKRVLVLLPEIALSAPWIRRYTDRFRVPPVVWHSGLTSRQRMLAWQAISRGDVPLVVGARSALFLPLGELGLIIVDEEHDSSFKQEEGAIYNARDLAERRAQIEGCPIIFASATPSIEMAARAGGVIDAAPLEHLCLPSRFGGAAMPRIRTVDLRKDRPERQHFLSGAVRASLQSTLEAGEQSLVFLNRRGFAPLTLCRACGHRLQCPSCSAWLVSHRFKKRLICHHCNYGIAEPKFCPECGSVDSLVASGPGVERLADEIVEILPGARIEMLTSDHPGSGQIPALLEAMVEGQIDVLIGTQIIAKGHHFPRLTNVVVADADLGLAGGDLRAAERSFQLLYQVAGRAGRDRLEGNVLIQTHLPDHPVIHALCSADKDRFYDVEMAERQALEMPPFGRLAALIIAGPDARQVQDQARKIARAAPDLACILVLGPAPAPLSLLRGRYRERILVKCSDGMRLPEILRGWLGGIRLPAKVHLAVDVDPISFL
jgi:primosomal protein N' (replication factor Y)